MSLDEEFSSGPKSLTTKMSAAPPSADQVTTQLAGVWVQPLFYVDRTRNLPLPLLFQ